MWGAAGFELAKLLGRGNSEELTSNSLSFLGKRTREFFFVFFFVFRCRENFQLSK